MQLTAVMILLLVIIGQMFVTSSLASKLEKSDEYAQQLLNDLLQADKIIQKHEESRTQQQLQELKDVQDRTTDVLEKRRR